MPFGAFGGRADVMALFDPRSGPLAHSGTFNNNVLTMAAGHAGLTRLFPPEAAGAPGGARRGDARRGSMRRCVKEGVALQFTGHGFGDERPLRGGEVRSGRKIWQQSTARLRQLFFFHLLREGIYASPRGFIVLSLPLADADIDRYVAAIGSFIGEYRALLPGAR